jgi:hypothetical protein
VSRYDCFQQIARWVPPASSACRLAAASLRGSRRRGGARIGHCTAQVASRVKPGAYRRVSRAMRRGRARVLHHVRRPGQAGSCFYRRQRWPHHICGRERSTRRPPGRLLCRSSRHDLLRFPWTRHDESYRQRSGAKLAESPGDRLPGLLGQARIIRSPASWSSRTWPWGRPLSVISVSIWSRSPYRRRLATPILEWSASSTVCSAMESVARFTAASAGSGVVRPLSGDRPFVPRNATVTRSLDSVSSAQSSTQARVRANPPADCEHREIRVAGQSTGDVAAVGHDSETALSRQDAGQEAGSAPGLDEGGPFTGQLREGRDGNALLLRSHEVMSGLDRRLEHHPFDRDRAAMHAPDETAKLQIREVAPDRFANDGKTVRAHCSAN